MVPYFLQSNISAAEREIGIVERMMANKFSFVVTEEGLVEWPPAFDKILLEISIQKPSTSTIVAAAIVETAHVPHNPLATNTKVTGEVSMSCRVIASELMNSLKSPSNLDSYKDNINKLSKIPNFKNPQYQNFNKPDYIMDCYANPNQTEWHRLMKIPKNGMQYPFVSGSTGGISFANTASNDGHVVFYWQVR